MAKVAVKDFFAGKGEPLLIIAGPCVIESEELCLSIAAHLKELSQKLPLSFVFKASYDKANRSSVAAFRGPGLDEGLRILQKVREEYELPILTDVHSPQEALAAGEVCDIIQIPAFLCRQTDLLLAAGKSGAVVNIKKGQFVAPWDMKHVVEKVVSTGNEKVILTDRGTSFGYNNLVSDMRAIPIMSQFGYPVCFDATHSVQLPGSQGGSSGGNREFVPTLAKAAVAVGCHSLFIETHPNPQTAKSDGATMLPLDELLVLLEQVEKIHQAVQ